MEGRIRKFKVYWTNIYLGMVEGSTYEVCLAQARELGVKFGYSSNDHYILMEIR